MLPKFFIHLLRSVHCCGATVVLLQPTIEFTSLLVKTVQKL